MSFGHQICWKNPWLECSPLLGSKVNKLARNFYTTKTKEFVCLCVYPIMLFVVLRGMGLKLGMGVEDWPTRVKSIFSRRPHHRSKIIQRSNYLGNALWPPNLVRKNPDWSVCIAGVKDHVRATRVNKRSKCSEMKNCNQVNQVSWGQPQVKFLRMPYGHQIWWV